MYKLQMDGDKYFLIFLLLKNLMSEYILVSLYTDAGEDYLEKKSISN